MTVLRTIGTFALAASLAMPLATSASAQRDRDWHHDDRTILFSHSPLSHHIGTVAIDEAFLLDRCQVVIDDHFVARLLLENRGNLVERGCERDRREYLDLGRVTNGRRQDQAACCRGNSH